MPIVNCSDCGKEISDQSSVCVHCGCPVTNSNISIPDASQKQKSEKQNWWATCGCFAVMGITFIIMPGMRVYGYPCLVAAVIGCPLFFNLFKLKKWQRIVAMIAVCMIGWYVAKPNLTQVETKSQAAAKKTEADATRKANEKRATEEAQKKFLEFVTNDFWDNANKRNWMLDVKGTMLEFNELEYRREKPNMISLFLKTESSYISFAHGDPLAKVAVQSCLNWAIAHGFDPKNDRISIYVHVTNPHDKKSPTGRDLVESWGYAKYDPNNDRIEWVAAKK